MALDDAAAGIHSLPNASWEWVGLADSLLINRIWQK